MLKFFLFLKKLLIVVYFFVYLQMEIGTFIGEYKCLYVNYLIPVPSCFSKHRNQCIVDQCECVHVCLFIEMIRSSLEYDRSDHSFFMQCFTAELVRRINN